MYVCTFSVIGHLAVDSAPYKLCCLSLLVESEVLRTAAANTSLAVDRFHKQYPQPCSTVSITVLQSPSLLVTLFLSFGSSSNIEPYKQIVYSFVSLFCTSLIAYMLPPH